jgi:hypothetical protein
MTAPMSTRTPSTKGMKRDYRTLLGIIAVCAVILVWAWRAFSDKNTYDFRLAYFGGQIAWETGHPEDLYSWTGTPVLGGAMAIASRLWDETTAVRLLTSLNIAVVVVTIAIVVRRLRDVLSRLWLWIVAVGLASFGPVLSTVWWKQFNIIALVLALAGFAALRRDRPILAGGLIGLSVAVKPLAILLPFVLLARRSTRSAGIWALVYAVGLNLGTLGLLALHAHNLSVFDPLSSVQNFTDKSQPRYGLACSTLNFSPQALLCRTFGSQHWRLLEVVAWAATAVLAVWVVRALRGYDTASWESFAFACAFSTMVSPIDWSHYQVMLAPLFVLLIVRFTTVRTETVFWVGLVVAYVLATLMWTPYGTLTDAIHLRLPSSTLANPHPLITNIAQYSQYILIVMATMWYRRHGRATASRVGTLPPVTG